MHWEGGIIKMYYFQCFPSLVLDRVWEYSSHSENWLPQKTSKEGRDGKQLYLRFLRVRKQTQIGKLCMISYLFIKHHPWQWSLVHPSVVFTMNRYSDVMSRQYQKITSQQRRFCALEEAIFTVSGRSHNWWGAFLVKSCRPSWWNFYPFSCSLSSKSCTLDASYMLRLPRKANPKELSAPPSEMELSNHFVIWSPGYILHKTSWYFFIKILCLDFKYDIWCCSVIEFFVGW